MTASLRNRLKRSGVGALAAVLALHAPLAAAPVMAQEARQTLNVQGADIRAFIQDVARTTGRTFIVDPAVTGTVTVTSDRPLGRAQMFEVFLSTLRANGLVVTPTQVVTRRPLAAAERLARSRACMVAGTPTRRI